MCVWKILNLTHNYSSGTKKNPSYKSQFHRFNVALKKCIRRTNFKKIKKSLPSQIPHRKLEVRYGALQILAQVVPN